MSGDVTVLYFARLREAMGRAEERIALPAGVTDAGALMRHLSDSDETHRDAFGLCGIKVAVNQAQADMATPVKPGDEVAFFPPVTGG